VRLVRLLIGTKTIKLRFFAGHLQKYYRIIVLKSEFIELLVTMGAFAKVSMKVALGKKQTL